MSRCDEVMGDRGIYVVGRVRNQMRKTDPVQDAFGRFKNTEPHGVQSRNTAINTPSIRLGSTNCEWSKAVCSSTTTPAAPQFGQ